MVINQPDTLTLDTYYEESFDDFDAIVSGYKRAMRLSIFRKIKKRTYIVYQADCKGRLCLKKLKNQIGEFRYGFTSNEYDLL